MGETEPAPTPVEKVTSEESRKVSGKKVKGGSCAYQQHYERNVDILNRVHREMFAPDHILR
jgi:hypothetical protein